MVDVLKSIVEPLQKTAAVTSVYGEPVAAQGRTVIPVARVGYGFGGGAGHGTRKSGPDGPEGEGEGGGGGVMAMPIGVVEITEHHTRFVPLHDHRRMAWAGLLGIALGFLWAKRR